MHTLFVVPVAVISIHALRGEGDVSAVQSVFTDVTFQSTPSVGRATIDKLTFFADYSISIHALRGEGDHIKHSF